MVQPPASYHAAQIDLLDGRVNTRLAPAGEGQRGNWVDATASSATARVEAPSVVGHGASLGPGAEVGPHAVIGPGCAIDGREVVEGPHLDGTVTMMRIFRTLGNAT